MAKKGKQTRVVITLECTEQKGSGVPGMSRYNTTKVSKTTHDATTRQPVSGLHKLIILNKDSNTHTLFLLSIHTDKQNRRNNPDRMEIMKYNKYLKKHTLHREIKK